MEQKPLVKKKKSVFKRLLLILGLVVGLLILAAVVIAAFFQDAVGKQLISQINKQLKTELTVGEVDLSLLKKFPNASVILRDVTVMDIFKEPLLEAKELSFHFGLLSLFGKQVQVHSVAIKDGALNVRTDKRGKANYDIFKPTESDEPAKFNIALEKATLEKMELMYRDERQRQEMLALVQAAAFSGEFSSEKYDLKSTAKLATHFLDLDGVRYLAGKNLGYNATVFVDVAKGLYDLKSVEVSVEDNVFKLDGKVISQKNHSDFDLTATAADANLESVIALMPESVLKALGDFSSTGRFEFGASVKGRMSHSETPAIVMNVSLEDGKVNSPRLEEPFKDVSFEMNFTNGDQRKNQTTFFEIRDFKGYLNRQLITLSLRMDNLDDPYVDFSADGAVPLGYVYGLFNSPAITGGSGEIEFKNLKLNGLYKDMLSPTRIMAVTMSGDILFDDATLKVNEEQMVFDRGSLHFDNNLVALQDLKLDGAGSEINLKGNARNLLPALFSDSLNSQNVALEFDAELFSPKMDVARLMKLTDVPVREGEVKPEVYDSLKVENTQDRRRLTDLLKGTFNAQVNEFQYNKIEGKAFAGKLIFENKQMRIEGGTQAMSGNFDVDGTLFFEAAPRLEAKVSSESIDVNEFFRQAENFGQTYLTAENVEGRMNSKMLIHAYWDSTGQFLMDKLHVWAGLGVLDGALKNFKMLEQLSTFAKMSDLRDVRFANLQNWLEIKDSTLHLPVMFIQNNAMNMTICGEQTFDDRIDYSIKVNAGQVLTSKFKKSNPNLDPIPAKAHGFFNLYFNTHGTLDDYKFGTNKKKVKDQFKRSERQKQEIRVALVRAFGGDLKLLREPEKWEDAGEPSAAVEEDDVEYIEGF